MAKCEYPGGCKAPALNGGKLCYFHEPKMAEKRRASTAKGGKRKRTIKILRLDSTKKAESDELTANQVLSILFEEIRELQALKKLDNLNEHIRISLSKNIGSLCRVAVMAISGHIVAKDMSKIMSDIEKLKTIRGKY